MSRLSTITFVGMLVLIVAGCGNKEESNAPTPSTVTQPIAKAFDNRAVVNQPLPGTISVASVLIQPTNGNQRAKQVQKGRPDPFAGLFAQAGLSVPTTTTIPGTVPQLPRLSVPGGRQTVPGGSGSSRPTGGQQNSGSNSSRQKSNPNRGNTRTQPRSGQPSSSQSIPLPPAPVPDSGIETATPPPPQEPDLASNVAVTGVIQIGSETQAIVLVPNEGTSRYVRVGQRLSNGQVLVKRIEMNEGSDPVVILEQYGIEVARAVGEKPVLSAQAGTSTDGSQVPQPLPNTEGTVSPGRPQEAGSSQPLDNGSVPTTNTTPQSVDGSAVPTNTTPQSVDNDPDTGI